MFFIKYNAANNIVLDGSLTSNLYSLVPFMKKIETTAEDRSMCTDVDDCLQAFSGTNKS